MSAAKFMRELPTLAEANRRAIREVLHELADTDADIACCGQSVVEGALPLDRMEDEDARRQSR
jgi:predicted nucleotidyltransferase